VENEKPVTLGVSISDAAGGSSLKTNEDLRVHVRLIPSDGAEIVYAINNIDVVIIGYDNLFGRIKPLRRSLPLPPRADAAAEFTVNVFEPGIYEMEILLLVCNEAIHSMQYSFTVV